jgi:kynurenine formamidase
LEPKKEFSMVEAQRVRLSEAEFDALAQRLSNWGRWGPDDEAGTLHFITPEQQRRAAGLVRDGVTVSCAHNLAVAPAIDNGRPVRHLVYWADGETGAAGDYFALDPHGWTITHLDALSHIFYRGRSYNDRPLTLFKPSGVTANSVLTARDGIVSRGVLIDLPRAMGKEWMEPGEAASFETVKRALDQAGLQAEPGDILIFRTGRYARNAAKGTPPPADGLAGVSVECAEWVHASHVAALICDGGMDTQPSEVDGVRIPWHILTLTMMGMLIVDNADLEALAATCARLGRWEFQLVMAPLRLAGGTSSPVNPLAIF